MTSPVSDRIPQEIGGDRIIAKLGTGGMANVYHSTAAAESASAPTMSSFRFGASVVRYGKAKISKTATFCVLES